MPEISVVIPVYNEEASLAELTRLGDVAVQELDAARSEAAGCAAEAESWRDRFEEAQQALQDESQVEILPHAYRNEEEYLDDLLLIAGLGMALE